MTLEPEPVNTSGGSVRAKNSCCFNFYFLLAIIFAIGAALAYASLTFFATVKVFEALGFDGQMPTMMGYVSASAAAAYSLTTKSISVCYEFPDKLQKLFDGILQTFFHPILQLENLCKHFRGRSYAAVLLEDLFGQFGVLATSLNAFFTGLGSLLGVDLLASQYSSLQPLVIGISIYIGIASFITNTAFGAPISSKNLRKFAHAIIRKSCGEVCVDAETRPLLTHASVLTVLQGLNKKLDNDEIDLESGVSFTEEERREYKKFMSRFQKVVGFWHRYDHEFPEEVAGMSKQLQY